MNNYFKSIELRVAKSKYRKSLFGRKIRVSQYKLLKTVNYYTRTLPKVEKITIEKGFVFDGGSIPKILWSLVGSPFDTDMLGCYLIHDKACTDKIVSRQIADILLLEAMGSAGISKIRKVLFYSAVAIFGLIKFGKKYFKY